MVKKIFVMILLVCVMSSHAINKETIYIGFLAMGAGGLMIGWGSYLQGIESEVETTYSTTYSVDDIDPAFMKGGGVVLLVSGIGILLLGIFLPIHEEKLNALAPEPIKPIIEHTEILLLPDRGIYAGLKFGF